MGLILIDIYAWIYSSGYIWQIGSKNLGRRGVGPYNEVWFAFFLVNVLVLSVGCGISKCRMFFVQC